MSSISAMAASFCSKLCVPCTTSRDFPSKNLFIECEVRIQCATSYFISTCIISVGPTSTTGGPAMSGCRSESLTFSGKRISVRSWKGAIDQVCRAVRARSCHDRRTRISCWKKERLSGGLELCTAIRWAMRTARADSVEEKSDSVSAIRKRKKAWRTSKSLVDKRSAATRACIDATRYRLQRTILSSSKSVRLSTDDRVPTAKVYMANMTASVGFGTASRFHLASMLCCWRVGTWTTLVRGLTRSTKICQSRNMCLGSGCSSTMDFRGHTESRCIVKSARGGGRAAGGPGGGGGGGGGAGGGRRRG